MKVLFSPQLNEENVLTYAFSGDVITATLNGVSDVFDFTGMPDGEAGEISSSLSIKPVLEARRVGGVLEVVLLSFIGLEATQEEKFPTWQVK